MRNGCGCGGCKSKAENTKGYKRVRHPVPRPRGVFMDYQTSMEAWKLMNTMEYLKTVHIQIRKCIWKENNKNNRQKRLLCVPGKTCILFPRCSGGAGES